MSVNATSSRLHVTPSTVIQVPRVGQGRDQDGDNDAGASKTSKGGGMGQALAQALKSLGLPTPSPSSSNTSPNTAGGSTPAAADTASANAPDSVKQGVRDFMHVLFQAVKAERPASDSTSSISKKSGFANGLSALISQVSGGAAPAELQSAFDKLAADLQPVTTTGTASASDSAEKPSTVTLQKLLDQVQQNLGYGPTSKSVATGLFVIESA
jgi:hypothetical protein